MSKPMFEVVTEVIAWSTEAAREHVELCVHNGESPDSSIGMGLWQSFQYHFPKEDKEGRNIYSDRDRELLITAMRETYSHTVINIAKALTPKV